MDDEEGGEPREEPVGTTKGPGGVDTGGDERRLVARGVGLGRVVETPAGDRPWLLRAGCALLGVLVVAAAMSEARLAVPSVYDEGFVLVEAMRLADGERPFRDYDPVYGPLEPALLAVAGPRLLTLRLLRALALAGVTVALAVAAWRLGARAGAPLVAAAVGWAWDPGVHPAIAPVVVACVALALAGPGSEPERGPARARRWLLVTGACAGVGLLLRAEFGVLAVGAAVGAVIIDGVLRREVAGALRAAGVVLLGALPFALAALGVVVAGGVDRALALSRATRASMPFRELPYPVPPHQVEDVPFAATVAFAPPLVAVVAALVLGRQALLLRTREGSPPPRLAIHLLLVVVGLLPYAGWRSDRPHLVPAFVVAAALACAALRPLERRLRERSLHGTALAMALLLAMTLGLRIGEALRDGRAPSLTPSRLPVLAGLLVPDGYDASVARVVEAVEAHAAPGAPVFVGTGAVREGQLRPEHDRVFINDALLYAILGRPVAVRHHCFVPGITTTEATQAELVADLERRDVRVVVLAFDLYRPEPNRNVEVGAHLLDDWLVARFRPAAATSRFAVLVRRDE